MISRKILITEKDNKIWMFELEDEKIVEIHLSSADDTAARYALGNIYVGKVKNIVPNIGAAFIEIENGVECYYDMSEAANAVFTRKEGKKPLCVGDELIVQISKEAIKTKARTVSSNLSFNGKYAILTSGNTNMGASAKLPKVMRDKWKQRLKEMKNDEYGIIIRTNAKEAEPETVFSEIEELKKSYVQLRDTAVTRKCFSRLMQAPPSYITDLKNVYTEGLSEIIVEGKELYSCIQTYFERERPEDLDKLRLYEEPRFSLCQLYSLSKVVNQALSEKVWLKSGGYLIIQYTEALTVIDVNSGKCDIKKDRMATYFKINLEAAKEAAKQIRLRNLSGIIVVDFINLDAEEAKNVLLRSFRQYLEKDPIQATLVDVTELQLVEVTRKKVRKPLYECLSQNSLSKKEKDE